MSASRKRFRWGQTECGYDMTETPWYLHMMSFAVMASVLLFSYAALLENGIWTAITGFLFGFGFLLLIYGHHIDRFYVHIGDKFKIGADSYDPDRTVHTEDTYVEIDDER